MKARIDRQPLAQDGCPFSQLARIISGHSSFKSFTAAIALILILPLNLFTQETPTYNSGSEAIEAFLNELKIAGPSESDRKSVFERYFFVQNIDQLLQPSSPGSVNLRAQSLIILNNWTKISSAIFATDYQNVSVELLEASVESSYDTPRTKSSSSSSSPRYKNRETWVVASYYHPTKKTWMIWNWVNTNLSSISSQRDNAKMRTSMIRGRPFPTAFLPLDSHTMNRNVVSGFLSPARKAAEKSDQMRPFQILETINTMIGENSLIEPEPPEPEKSKASEPPKVEEVQASVPTKAPPNFIERDHSKPPFDRLKLGLSTEQLNEAATLLGSFARRNPPQDKKQFDLASKEIALALALSPENKAANVTLMILLNESEFKPLKTAPTNEEFCTKVQELIETVMKSGDPEGVKLAALLADLAISTGAASDDLIYSASQLKAKGNSPDWTAFTEKSNSTSGAIDILTLVKKNQTKIHGLVVQDLGNGKYAGFAMEIIATPVIQQSTNNPGARFTSQVGKMMSASLLEAVRAVKVKAPWPEKLCFDFSFNNQYQLKDGPSAATAYAINMLSVMEGFDIDERIAITGDLSADCVVRPVGGVASKVRGARKSGCSIVGIPTATSWEIEDDLVFGDSYEPIWKTQIFTINHLDDAVSISKKQKNDELAKAISLFNGLQQKIENTNSYSRPIDPDTEKILKEVLSIAPNHLSADLLLKSKTNSLRSRLTIKSSAVFISAMANTIFSYVDAYNKSKVTQSQAFFDNIDNEIAQISHKIDPSMQDLLDNLKKMVSECKDFDRNSSRGANLQSIRTFNQSLAIYRTELNKVLKDPKIVEALNE